MLTNGIGSKSLQVNLSQAERATSKSVQRIASGKKIEKASDNVADSQILTSFDAKTRALTQMMSNEQSQASVLQSASDSLSTSANILQSLSTLTNQAANGTLTEQERTAIQQQIEQLASQVDSTANQSQYNGRNLLDGTFSTQLQNGKRFAIDAMTANALGLNNISVATMDGAKSAMGSIQSALNKVVSAQGSIGSALKGISSNISNLQNQQMNSISAKSQVGDVDLANEAMNMALNQIKSGAAFKAFNIGESTRLNALNILAE